MAKSKEDQRKYYLKRKAKKEAAKSGSQEYNSNGDFIKKIDIPAANLDGLPTFSGSEKQKKWANDIAQSAIKSVHDALYLNAQHWNDTIDQRSSMLARGVDVSKYAKLTPADRETYLKTYNRDKDTANLLDASLRGFFEKHSKAGTIIEVRGVLPSNRSSGERMIERFSTMKKKFEENGRPFTTQTGVEYLEHIMKREGYDL